MNFNPTSELTWALILGLAKNLKKKLIICIKVIGKQHVGLSLREKF